MNDKLVGKTVLTDNLRRTQVQVGDISVVVRSVELRQGLPFGRVYVALPETQERPGVVVTAGVALAHPASAYLSLNRDLQNRGYSPENGILKHAVGTALKPYVEFVEEQEPEFKTYD